MSVIAMPAATPDTIADLHTNAVTTAQLPVLTAAAFLDTDHGTRHERPGAVSVWDLGARPSQRGPRAHSANQLGDNGWRFAR